MSNTERHMTDEEAVSYQFFLNGQLKNCVEAMVACVVRYQQECPDGLLAKHTEQNWIDLEAQLHDAVTDMLSEDISRISTTLTDECRFIGQWKSRWQEQFEVRRSAELAANRLNAA
ncbi:hypothetical protein [Limnoglobus roseus]|uniref:Uncharacterized protein n=1 Tax=Limnoglobus roseus TaxID=2598579 RepID=A0A5C1AFM2_9BACT|nr:hypothetical protein [Limnoglobus roseus]QEL16776.1 hypothetical protein PX52LOC_03746 [Limnoglobus roseus]